MDVARYKPGAVSLAETETAAIIATAYSGISDKGCQGLGVHQPVKTPQGGELLDGRRNSTPR